MPTIRFTRPYVVQNHEGRHFAEGELLECTSATANHFISRQAAILVANKIPPPAADEVPKPTKTKPRKISQAESDDAI